MAPAGTVTVRDVAEAAVTSAFIPPINTVLFAAVVLKLAPVMVTEVPTGPDPGEKELMTGCAMVFNDIHTASKKRIKPCCRCLGPVVGKVIIAPGMIGMGLKN
jgi:hypothetical protein